MLDIADFVVEKGGDPNKIKESQRRRYASEEVVDEVIALYEDHRRSTYRSLHAESPYSHLTCQNSPLWRHPDQSQDQRRPEADRS